MTYGSENVESFAGLLYKLVDLLLLFGGHSLVVFNAEGIVVDLDGPGLAERLLALRVEALDFLVVATFAESALKRPSALAMGDGQL